MQVRTMRGEQEEKEKEIMESEHVMPSRTECTASMANYTLPTGSQSTYWFAV